MGLRLVVLGDSIAWGQGADLQQDRLAPRLVRGLQARGFDVESQVVASPGERSSGLAQQVTSALAWHPNLALVVIGANDLTHLEPWEPVVAALATAVRRLRSAGAEVVVAPAPDLSAVPMVPPFLREVVRAAGRQLHDRQAEAVRLEGGRVADPEQRTSRAFGQDPALFSADRFHPSSAGYAVIADALLPTLAEAAEAAEAAGRPRGDLR